MRFLLLPLLFCLLVVSACSSKRLPENCYLQPESGKCRASIMRWYRDDRTGVCKAFVWGGCDGVVPFETQESCAAQCMAGMPATDALTPAGKNLPVTTPAAAPPSTPASAPAPAAVTTP